MFTCAQLSKVFRGSGIRRQNVLGNKVREKFEFDASDRGIADGDIEENDRSAIQTGSTHRVVWLFAHGRVQTSPNVGVIECLGKIGTFLHTFHFPAVMVLLRTGLIYRSTVRLSGYLPILYQRSLPTRAKNAPITTTAVQKRRDTPPYVNF